jgi:hypothetical protein
MRRRSAAKQNAKNLGAPTLKDLNEKTERVKLRLDLALTAYLRKAVDLA